MKSIRTLFFLLVGCKSALIYAMAQTYSPSNDANICVWFKADALGLTNNAAVSKWAPSAGGTNWTLQQTASNQQPIFQTSAQNGRSAVLFDGVSSFLTNSSPKLTASYQPYTIFLVYRYAGPLNAFQSYYLGNTPGVPSWFFGCRQGSNAVYAGGIGSIVPIDPNWHMVMLVVNGASSKYRIDGGPDTPLSGNPGTTPICSLEMGGQAGKASLARVYLGELLIYNGNQSANEAAIFNYLESRWAIIHLQQNPQFSFSWTDRRPIGMDILGGAEYVTASNPRGWFSKGGADVTTSNGLAAFRSKLLARAAIEVSILKSMNAQGVIVWDIEGQEIRGLTYFGDPTKLPVMAPEMDAVADDFFKMFTSAGLRVGLCLRPQTFGAGTSLPAGTNGDVFVKVNAKFGQKEYYYTNGWMLVTNVPAPVSAQSYQPELLDKVRVMPRSAGDAACSTLIHTAVSIGMDRHR